MQMNIAIHKSEDNFSFVTCNSYEMQYKYVAETFES